jgi:hypothetical protein
MLDLDHLSEQSHLDSIALKLLHFIPNISGALHARFRTLQDQRSHLTDKSCGQDAGDRLRFDILAIGGWLGNWQPLLL